MGGVTWSYEIWRHVAEIAWLGNILFDGSAGFSFVNWSREVERVMKPADIDPLNRPCKIVKCIFITELLSAKLSFLFFSPIKAAKPSSRVFQLIYNYLFRNMIWYPDDVTNVLNYTFYHFTIIMFYQCIVITEDVLKYLSIIIIQLSVNHDDN